MLEDNLTGIEEKPIRRGRRNKVELFLDIGSSRISGALVEIPEGEKSKILSHSEIANTSMIAGQITDHKSFSLTLVALIDELESVAGTRAEVAHLSCSSPSVNFEIEEASRFIGGGIVRTNDIVFLMNKIRNTPSDKLSRVVYDALIDVSLDGTGGVFNAEGLFCHSLGIKMVKQSLSEVLCINFEKIFNQINLPLVTIENAASVAGIAVLSEEEKKQGAVLIDFGHSTTSVVIFADGHPQEGKIFPIGGKSMTDDLAKGLPVSTDDAESIKCRHGSLALFGSESLFTLENSRMSSSLEERPITRQEVCEIITPRVAENFEMVKNYLDRSKHYAALSRTIVACGRASQLKGFDIYAQHNISNRCWRFESDVDYDGYLIAPPLLGLIKMVAEEERDPFSGPLHLNRSLWQRLKLWLRYHV